MLPPAASCVFFLKNVLLLFGFKAGKKQLSLLYSLIEFQFVDKSVVSPPE